MSIQSEIARISGAVSDQGQLLDIALEMILGKAAGGGGVPLPEGIGGVSSGTVTITQTPTEYFIIDHNLGVVPNLMFLIINDDISDSPKPGVLITSLQFVKNIRKVTSSGTTTTYNTNYVKQYFKDNGEISTSSGSANGTYFTDTQMMVAQQSVLVNLLPGYTYRWICAKINGLE